MQQGNRSGSVNGKGLEIRSIGAIPTELNRVLILLPEGREFSVNLESSDSIRRFKM
jgi:hypothetical protein